MSQSQISTNSDVFLPPKSASTHGPASPVTINRSSPVTIIRSPRTVVTPGTLVSDVTRPVSISSVQPKICQTPPPLFHTPETPPYHFHKEPPPHLHMETKTTQTEELWVIIECCD